MSVANRLSPWQSISLQSTLAKTPPKTHRRIGIVAAFSKKKKKKEKNKKTLRGKEKVNPSTCAA